jgi:hypothetical protein
VTGNFFFKRDVLKSVRRTLFSSGVRRGKIDGEGHVGNEKIPSCAQYEDKSDIKFKFSTFNKNVNRVKSATAGFDPEIIVRQIQ